MRFIMLFLLGVGVFTGIPVFAQDTTAVNDGSYVDTALAYDQMLTGYEYPYDIHNFEFSSQGQDLNMAYMYLPPQQAEKPVVTLLHGKNFNAAYWATTAELLQALGYGVLMPDQIGFGKSSKPIDYQYSFEALANNTKMLLDELEVSQTIVTGHSLGGMLASRFSLMYPTKVTKLILVNPIGLENYLEYVDYKDIDFFYQNELSQSPEKIISYQKKNYYDGQWNAQYAALAKPLIGWVNGSDWEHLAQVSARTYDMLFTGSVIEEFDEFQMPVALIIGTRDRTGPGRNWKKEGVERELGRYDRLGDEVKKRNPNIDVIELNELGHLPHIESFVRFKLEFQKALEN